jgi:hypothetical protein
MSAYTLLVPRPRTHSAVEDLGPILASDLPATSTAAIVRVSRLRQSLRKRREVRAFERAVCMADPNERGDLMAMYRRS